jgi:hypothetical protein
MIPEVAGGALAPAPPWSLLRALRERSISRRAALLIAYAVAAIPAVVMAFVQPVWQLTDEAQHFDVIAQYANAEYPIEGATTLRPETVAVMVATGNYRWSPPETAPRPAVVDPVLFGPPPPYLSGYQFQLWVRRHIWWFSYEAMQPPLFYAAATPAWMAAEHIGGPFAAVNAVRVLNALVLALLAPMVLLGSWLLAPGRRWIGPIAVAVTISLPGLLLNGTQVTNDTFGAVLGSATVLAAAWTAHRGWTGRRAALIGLLFGLTLLAKLTAAGLAVALVVAAAWPALRQSSLWLRQLRYGALAAAISAAVMVPWFAINLFEYGHPVPTAEAARLLGAGTSGARYNLLQSLDYCYATFWTGEHRDTLPYTGLFEVAMLIFGIGSAFGVLRLALGEARFRAQPAPLAVMLTAVGAQFLWAMSLPYTGGLGGMTPGRYIYPAVLASIVLFVGGAVAVIQRLTAQLLCTALFVSLSALNFAAYAAGRTAIPHEDRTGPPPSGSVIVVSGEGFYRGVSIAADRVVPDLKNKAVWVHIHVHNDSPLSADWWPAAWAQLPNGSSAGGDYASSTPFPETLSGNADFWGWIRIDLSPSRLDPGSVLRLRFPDVAANHYRDVGTLTVEVSLPTAGVGGDGSVVP